MALEAVAVAERVLMLAAVAVVLVFTAKEVMVLAVTGLMILLLEAVEVPAVLRAHK
jgi:hypothetical protein